MAGFTQQIETWRRQQGLTKGAAVPNQYPLNDIIGIADNLLLTQRNNGGWPGHLHPMQKVSADDRQRYLREQNRLDATYRNHNIFPQIFYLSHVYLQTGDVRYRNSAKKALRLVMESQLYNGGWTLTARADLAADEDHTIDLATTLDALIFLRKVAAGEMPYGYIPFDVRRQAAEAVRNGDQLVLRLQQAHNSRLSIWSGSYSLKSSQAVASEGEGVAVLNVPLSVRIVKYFMAIQRPPAEVVRSVQGAGTWFEANTLQRWRARQVAQERAAFVPPKSTKTLPNTPLWAARYAITQSSPLLSAATAAPNVSWLGRPKITGSWAKSLIEKDLDGWREANVKKTKPEFQKSAP